jgi:hypothetical protein
VKHYQIIIIIIITITKKFVSFRYENVIARDGRFQGVKDRFNGITVDSVTENKSFENDSEFESILLSKCETTYCVIKIE